LLLLARVVLAQPQALEDHVVHIGLQLPNIGMGIGGRSRVFEAGQGSRGRRARYIAEYLMEDGSQVPRLCYVSVPHLGRDAAELLSHGVQVSVVHDVGHGSSVGCGLLLPLQPPPHVRAQLLFLLHVGLGRDTMAIMDSLRDI
jgi:hypothetical protein